MKTEYIAPFVSNTANVLKTMASVDPKPLTPYQKSDGVIASAVSGIIGLAGEAVQGSMIISFDAAPILTIVSNMLGEEFTEVDGEIADAVGELTNMICGGARRELAEMDLKIEMATPITIIGNALEIQHLKTDTITVIPFELDNGKFYVEASIEDKPS